MTFPWRTLRKTVALRRKPAAPRSRGPTHRDGDRDGARGRKPCRVWRADGEQFGRDDGYAHGLCPRRRRPRNAGCDTAGAPPAANAAAPAADDTRAGPGAVG